MQKHYTAFTLLELIIVMAIVGIMSALGIQGLVLFRQTTQFKQAEADVITVFNNVRNKARNSVASGSLVSDSTLLPDAVVDGYAIYFENDTYSLYRCDQFVNQWGVLMGDCEGGLEEDDIKPRSLQEVNVFPLHSATCVGLFFERLSGEIYAMERTYRDSLENSGKCVYRIQHKGNEALQKDIVIDTNNNTSDVFL